MCGHSHRRATPHTHRGINLTKPNTTIWLKFHFIEVPTITICLVCFIISHVLEAAMGGTRGEDGVVRGRISWFVVESKSFEILVEDLGGKRKGCIWERNRGVIHGLDLGRLVYDAYWKE